MMRLLPMLLLCFALSGLICECAFAFGKITVDPNASGSAASKAPVIIDARLAQQVTYEARYVPVQQILQDLSEMTKIELYAGSNKNDWPVRSRKMNIFVKDVKMADLMNSIAHVMKFKWTRNDDVNPPTYRLIVDGKATAAADAQIGSALKRSEEQWQKRRQDWIDMIMRYGRMSDAQLESVCETNPILHSFARRGVIQALYSLFEEVPETENRYAAGQSFRISSKELSSETTALLFNASNELWKILQRMGIISEKQSDPVGYNGEVEPDETFDIACYRLDKGCFTPNLRWEESSIGNTGYFHIMKGESDFEIANLPRMDSDWEQWRGEAVNAIMDGDDLDHVFHSYGVALAKQMKDLKKEEDLLYPGEPLNKHPDFDELWKTVKLIIDTPKTDPNPELAITSYIAIVQKALADATGLCVVSDSWACANGVRRMPGEIKLSELLDKISEQYNYNWDKSSNVLEFRHRMWWKNRLNQISDDRVAKWSKNTSKNGVLSLEDLAQIATLNYYQAEESLKPDKVLGTAGIYGQILSILDANGNLHWLRLYSTLNSQQRTFLTDRWISGAMLTPDQWKLAQTMFDRIGSLRSDALFSLRIIPNDKELIYEFREFEVNAQRNDDDSAKEDRKWKVTLPKYTKPASPKKR